MCRQKPLSPSLFQFPSFSCPLVYASQKWALYNIIWSALSGTQQMVILPTRHVVFQEEVKLIGHTAERLGNTSSYGNNAILDAIFLRHIFMHSWVDLDTLRQIFGMLAPWLMISPNKLLYCFSIVLY